MIDSKYTLSAFCYAENCRYCCHHRSDNSKASGDVVSTATSDFPSSNRTISSQDLSYSLIVSIIEWTL